MVLFLTGCILLGIPDENARARILSVLSRKLRLEGSFDFKRIARRTPGFVGADLAALSKEAAALAVKRIFSGKENRFGTPVRIYFWSWMMTLYVSKYRELCRDLSWLLQSTLPRWSSTCRLDK